jgi:hypothetical protein
MTSRTEDLPRQHTSNEPPRRSTSEDGRPMWIASTLAGGSLLLIAALSAFGVLFALQGLITPGNAAKTAQDMAADEGLFRAGLASAFVVVVLDVVAAWALLRVFSPVSKAVSTLDAWFRVAYAAVFMVALSQLAGIPSLLRDEEYQRAFGTEQLQATVLAKTEAFHDLWMAALILFGVHLLMTGYLTYRSGYLPKTLGVLIAVSGFGYLFDSFGTFLSQGSPLIISTVTFLGEFLLAWWLVLRARHIASTAHDVPEAR